MPPAGSDRLPVAVLNLFQLAAPAAIFAAAALRLPAVELDLFGGVTDTLFGTHTGGREVLLATTACAVLGLAQAVAIRDPARGTRRYWFGVALAVLAVAAGLVAARGAYRVGFVPVIEEVDSRPRTAAYVGLFGGAAFSALAVVRLTRFFEPQQPPATAPDSTP
jgi:hypothetical protein